MTTTIRLLSWNVHGLPLMPGRARRLARCARAIAERAPALALLQEVWLQKDVATFTRALRPDEYDAVGPPASFGLRTGGLLTFVSAAAGWRIVDHTFERFEAHAPAWRVWEADGIMQKGLHVIRLAGRAGRLTIVNTHLQAEYSAGDAPAPYAAIRRSQLRQLTKTVNQAAREAPVLVAGDFNTRPDEVDLYAPLADGGWIDLTAALRRSRGGRGTCIDHDRTERAWLDHAFAAVPSGVTATAEASLICSTARDVPFSDHHALVIDVSLIRC